MRCPICSEEVKAEDQAERWGPEFAHATCVTAYEAGKAAERERLAEACNAYAVRLRAMPYPELPTPVEVANDLRDLALGPNAE